MSLHAWHWSSLIVGIKPMVSEAYDVGVFASFFCRWKDLVFLRLQLQLAVLTPHLVQQLTWGRFINTHGGLGKNTPCYLHNKHFDRLFKEAISHMGANFTKEATTRVARSVTFISHVADRFEKQTNIHPSAHPP